MGLEVNRRGFNLLWSFYIGFRTNNKVICFRFMLICYKAVWYVVVKWLSCWCCMFSSSSPLSHWSCAHTAALWRCVFVYVWVWNRFFVPEWWCDDGDSSLICVYMRERKKEREGERKKERKRGETSQQYIMNHNKAKLHIGTLQSNVVRHISQISADFA